MGLPSRAREEHGRSAPMVSRRSDPLEPAPVPAPAPPPGRPKTIWFLTTAKRELAAAGEPHKYEEFLDVLREFRNGSIGVTGVIDRVKVVFNGHPDLIRRFSLFVPTRELKLQLVEEGGPSGDIEDSAAL